MGFFLVRRGKKEKQIKAILKFFFSSRFSIMFWSMGPIIFVVERKGFISRFAILQYFNHKYLIMVRAVT
jgi:hypothetical protein